MLKKTLFAFFIILTYPAFSQQFEGGFLGGFSAAQIDGDEFSGYNKLGITAGAYITKELSSSFKLKTEIRYIQKGAYQKPTEFNAFLFKTSLQYAELPVMLQFFYSEKIYLELGLIPEVLLSSKEEDQNGLIPIDQKLEFHRYSLEAGVGAGYFLTNNLAAGFRYSYSLLTARDHASGQMYMLNRGQYNNVLSFTIYYHFR